MPLGAFVFSRAYPDGEPNPPFQRGVFIVRLLDIEDAANYLSAFIKCILYWTLDFVNGFSNRIFFEFAKFLLKAKIQKKFFTYGYGKSELLG